MSLRRQAQVEGGRDDSWDARLSVITTLGGIVTAFLWLVQPILRNLVQALIQIRPPA